MLDVRLDVVRVRGADQGAGDRLVVASELEGEADDVDALRPAMLHRLAAAFLDRRGGRVPGWHAALGEQAHAGRRGVDDADALALEVGGEVAERSVVEFVVAEGQHGLDDAGLGAVEDGLVDAEREAGDADVADDALLFQAEQGRQGFVEDLVVVGELDVVALDQVDVIDAEALQAVLDAALGGRTRVIVVAARFGVAADLRGEQVRVARHAFQRAAEAEFRESLAVGGRDVDEVHAALERGLDGGDAVIERDLSEDGAERRRAEAENGDLEAGGAERAGFHGGGNDGGKAAPPPCRIFADA